jgi:hypothetical protein
VRKSGDPVSPFYLFAVAAAFAFMAAVVLKLV